MPRNNWGAVPVARVMLATASKGWLPELGDREDGDRARKWKTPLGQEFELAKNLANKSRAFSGVGSKGVKTYLQAIQICMHIDKHMCSATQNSSSQCPYLHCPHVTGRCMKTALNCLTPLLPESGGCSARNRPTSHGFYPAWSWGLLRPGPRGVPRPGPWSVPGHGPWSVPGHGPRGVPGPGSASAAESPASEYRKETLHCSCPPPPRSSAEIRR